MLFKSICFNSKRVVTSQAYSFKNILSQKELLLKTSNISLTHKCSTFFTNKNRDFPYYWIDVVNVVLLYDVCGKGNWFIQCRLDRCSLLMSKGLMSVERDNVRFQQSGEGDNVHIRRG